MYRYHHCPSWDTLVPSTRIRAPFAVTTTPHSPLRPAQITHESAFSVWSAASAGRVGYREQPGRLCSRLPPRPCLQGISTPRHDPVLGSPWGSCCESSRTPVRTHAFSSKVHADPLAGCRVHHSLWFTGRTCQTVPPRRSHFAFPPAGRADSLSLHLHQYSLLPSSVVTHVVTSQFTVVLPEPLMTSDERLFTHSLAVISAGEPFPSAHLLNCHSFHNGVVTFLCAFWVLLVRQVSRYLFHPLVWPHARWYCVQCRFFNFDGVQLISCFVSCALVIRSV